MRLSLKTRLPEQPLLPSRPSGDVLQTVVARAPCLDRRCRGVIRRRVGGHRGFVGGGRSLVLQAAPVVPATSMPVSLGEKTPAQGLLKRLTILTRHQIVQDGVDSRADKVQHT